MFSLVTKLKVNELSYSRSGRSQMIFKIDVLKDFCNIHRKTHALEPVFDKGLGLEIFEKETPRQVFSCEYCKIFKNSFFYRTPLVAASVVGVSDDLINYVWN